MVIAEAFGRGLSTSSQPARSQPEFVSYGDVDAWSNLGRKRESCSLPSLPGDANAGWRRSILGYEKSRRERLARIHAIFLEVGDAFGGEERVVDQKIAGKAA
jgi:hypothetical protein